ncbi:uncharacterized protein TNCV_4606291 [Trichonephila clavipes]|nr:uncharacterized protein TNCV_4606291 [Trichonephila clavipes]
MRNSKSEMDSTSTKSEVSYKSRSSILCVSRSETSNPTTPVSDCARRRHGMTKLQQQDHLLIEGYKKFLAYQKTIKDENGISNGIMQNHQETKEARDKLVSELKTIPPCEDSNGPDHFTLESKAKNLTKPIDDTKLNDKDFKKNRKGKIVKITRMTLSFQVKLSDLLLQVLKLVDIQNSFENLEQDPEPHHDQTTEILTPKPPPPSFLKN